MYLVKCRLGRWERVSAYATVLQERIFHRFEPRSSGRLKCCISSRVVAHPHPDDDIATTTTCVCRVAPYSFLLKRPCLSSHPSFTVRGCGRSVPAPVKAYWKHLKPSAATDVRVLHAQPGPRTDHPRVSNFPGIFVPQDPGCRACLAGQGAAAALSRMVAAPPPSPQGGDRGGLRLLAAEVGGVDGKRRQVWRR